VSLFWSLYPLQHEKPYKGPPSHTQFTCHPGELRWGCPWRGTARLGWPWDALGGPWAPGGGTGKHASLASRQRTRVCGQFFGGFSWGVDALLGIYTHGKILRWERHSRNTKARWGGPTTVSFGAIVMKCLPSGKVSLWSAPTDCFMDPLNVPLYFLSVLPQVAFGPLLPQFTVPTLRRVVS